MTATHSKECERKKRADLKDREKREKFCAYNSKIKVKKGKYEKRKRVDITLN